MKTVFSKVCGLVLNNLFRQRLEAVEIFCSANKTLSCEYLKTWTTKRQKNLGC